MLQDRLGEPQLGAMRGQRRSRRDRLGGSAQRLVEPLGKVVAEARREGLARQGVEALDPCEAQPLQHQGLLGCQAQGRDRQGPERRPAAAGLDDRGVVRAEARERPGSTRAVGDRGARMQAAPPEALQQVQAQRRLAAEQMGAAGDVEPERARPVAGRIVVARSIAT